MFNMTDFYGNYGPWASSFHKQDLDFPPLSWNSSCCFVALKVVGTCCCSKNIAHIEVLASILNSPFCFLYEFMTSFEMGGTFTFEESRYHFKG